MNKEISTLVKYAKVNGHKTFISTNVTLLATELTEELIKNGLDDIHLCLMDIQKKLMNYIESAPNLIL